MKTNLKRFQPPTVPVDLAVTPRCVHFGVCGGCSLQHMGYLPQVEWRARQLLQVLAEEGELSHLPALEIVAMEDPWGYRSKMEFSFSAEGGPPAERLTLGLHERGKFNRIVDITQCHIAVPGVSELLRAIRETASRFPFKSYDPKTHQGFWRYAVIRSSSSGDLMLLLLTNEGPEEPIAELGKVLPQKIPALKSFHWGLSTKISDVAFAEKMTRVAGADALEDRIGDIRFHIRPINFVQPNLILVPRIYDEIRQKAALTGREVVYDLYCGIGLIALSLAGRAQAVYGVESEEGNVASAEENAALNGIDNAIFLHGKVEDLLKGRSLFKAGPKPDLLVVDPPRIGLHKQVYGPLLDAQASTLLYLSCHPVSLARDLKILLSRDPGLRIDSVQMFDFFPHTTHLEVLVTLRR